MPIMEPFSALCNFHKNVKGIVHFSQKMWLHKMNPPWTFHIISNILFPSTLSSQYASTIRSYKSFWIVDICHREGERREFDNKKISSIRGVERCLLHCFGDPFIWSYFNTFLLRRKVLVLCRFRPELLRPWEQKCDVILQDTV